MSGEILPPREPISDENSNVTRPWYRYLVGRKRITDAMSDVGSLIIGDVPSVLPNARQLAVEAPITADDAGEGLAYTLGHADSGVAAATYGAATKLVVLAIDAKGHVTSASEVDLNSDNVTEGTVHLFFTEARARAAISGGGQVSYSALTGVIDTTGFSGGPALYTSLTFVNGICTAAS